MAISFNPQASSVLQSNLNKSSRDLNKANEQLASGKRLNRASDAAAIQIAASLAADSSGFAKASNNISDGLSQLNVAEGGVSAASDILTRQAELATQSANGAVSQKERDSLNKEYQQLSQELDRISASTEFNGRQLLGGNSTDIQVGINGSSASRITVSTPNVSSVGLGVASDISTQAGAQAAIDSAKQASDTLNSARADIGAAQARLEVADSSAQVSRQATREAGSRIEDADFADVVVQRAAAGIRQNASVAVLSQANVATENVLKLLR